MADELRYKIGFDLKSAVDKAAEEWDKTYAKKLETQLQKRALGVKLQFSTKNFDDLDDVKKRLAELKVEPLTPETQRQIKDLVRELKELARIMEKVSSFKGAELPELQRAKAAKINNDIAQSAEKLRLQQERVRQAQERLTLAQQRAAQQAYKTGSAYNSQGSYLSRLLKRMAVYASFSQVGNFLTQVREVTAQFELQRVSLGAIIQDQQKANELFAEIKSFALTSPLKILDLTKYTKQVAAYGIETKKLFNTTKMLADISVGLGTDMSRATLFYGQVFATGYLRASELRQATEMGIPLVAKLSQKLEELNGRAYTAADVMDLISKRAIGFDLVEQVFQDMTSTGGEFYNMQVKQSQTLFGMWSKLGDAAALMYDQIGNTSSVNSAMKTTIGLLEKMMRNWQTTGTILASLGFSTLVYVTALKNATIASKALAFAEGARLAITKAQVIATPKLVAAVIGQNAATKLSSILTKAHTAAMLQQSMATNVLTASFWRLTAAMLANPWAIALAAVVGLGYAIYNLTTRTESAADVSERLNDSIAAYQSSNKRIDELIKSYDELSAKTERTESEQRKLNDTIKEISSIFPDAVTDIDAFSGAIDISRDKVVELYNTLKNANEENLKNNLADTKTRINEIIALIGEYENLRKKGYGTFVDTEKDERVIGFALTENDKKEIVARIVELEGVLGELQSKVEEAQMALDGKTPEETNIDKFGAWKKKLTDFRKQVGNVRVALFDDSTIAQFGTLDEALKKTAEKYKENIALVKIYDDVLKSKAITAEERAKIEAEREEADTLATLAKEALDYYNTLSTAFDKGSGRQSDPRLNNLKEEISLTKKLYDEYNKLEKQIGKTKAAEKIQSIYANTIKTLQKRAGKYGFEFELPFTDDNLKTNMQHFIDKMRELQKLTDKKGKPLFPNIGKDIDEAVAQLEDVDLNSLQKTLDKKLKDLADRISRTKTAKEFYEKILGQTGDVELAANVSLAIYGDTGKELFKNTIEQIREVFKSGNADVDLQIGSEIDSVIDLDNERINYGELAKIYEKYQNQIIEKNRDTASKIVSEGQKTAASKIATWQKELEKAKDFEQQRTDIINRETQRRAEIIKSNLPQEEKDRLTQASQNKQNEEIANINFKEFKESDDYVKIFENLDNVSTAALKRLKENIQDVINANKDLSPENMKTLVKAMEQIDEQVSGRGFGNDMVQSVKDYIQAIKDLKTAKAELKAADAEYNAQLPQLDADIQTAKDEEIAAQTALNALKAQEVQDANAIVSAELRLNQATANVAKAEEKKAKAANKVKKAEAKVTGEQDKQKKATGKFFNDLGKVAQSADQLANILGDVKDLLGVSADSAAGVAFDSAIQGLNEFSKIMNTIIALQTLYNIVTSSNPWLAIAAAVLAVGQMLGSFIANNKVRKANKEIERQQELLEQLEYTYSRLEKAAEKAFGGDYINNFKQQQKNLQAQQLAYEKQLEAEKSKGKKADKEKIKEYEEKIRDVKDEIADLYGTISEKMLGTDLTSAARDFAQAWLDAYKEFGKTSDKMSEKFHEMIQNMVVEGALAKVMERALQPMFDMIDNMGEQDFYNETFWKNVVDKAEQGAKDADYGAQTMMRFLEQAGISMRDLGGELTGVSRDIAGASEESINGLAAAENTRNFYIAQMLVEVQGIHGLLQGNTPTTDNTEVVQWKDWQGGVMNNLNSLNTHAAEILVECKRSADRCEQIASDLHRTIDYGGGNARVRVRI